MKQTLSVALTHRSLEWQQALDQEKISYVILDQTGGSFDHRPYPVILITGPFQNMQKELFQFVHHGGGVIADEETKPSLNHLLPHQNIVIINANVKKVIGNHNFCEKKFIWNGTSVIEKVAQQPKGEIRIKIVNAIKQLLWKQHLPYVHLWYYPDTYDSVFGFRFDLDEHDEFYFENVLQLLKKYEHAISCFVCAKTYEPFRNHLKALASLDLEIGSHGYVHHVYASQLQNNWNLAEAERVLKLYRKEILSFCGPHGLWNPGLQQVLEKRGYRYSSEFSLNYDDFPFFPILGNRPSQVLQVPTHPICEGVLMERYGTDLEKINAYFAETIRRKADACEPVFLFGHPDKRIGKYPSILEHIFDCIEGNRKILKTSYEKFAEWWVMRHHLSADFEWQNGEISVHAPIPDRQVNAEILTHDGKRALIPLKELSKPTAIMDYTSAASVSNLGSTAPVLEEKVRHPFSKKMKLWLKSCLDWETKTPTSMLITSNIQSIVKYCLRLGYDLLKHGEGRR